MTSNFKQFARPTYPFIVSLLLCASGMASNRIVLNQIKEDVSISVLSSNRIKTVIKIQLNAFEVDSEMVGDIWYYAIKIDGHSNALKYGEPSTPSIGNSIIIPDEGTMSIEANNLEFVDMPNMPILPSWGPTINGGPVGLQRPFGDVYSINDWYPVEQISLGTPFVFRDFRGVAFYAFAFRYQPKTKMLRVFKSMVLTIRKTGAGGENILHRSASINPDKMLHEFVSMYKDFFINYREWLASLKDDKP